MSTYVLHDEALHRPDAVGEGAPDARDAFHREGLAVGIPLALGARARDLRLVVRRDVAEHARPSSKGRCSHHLARGHGAAGATSLVLFLLALLTPLGGTAFVV
eukprot:230197-Prymnesium_polylepis.1